MIQANELRIGNYVGYKFQSEPDIFSVEKVGYIQWVEDDTGWSIGFSNPTNPNKKEYDWLDEISGIPLTEEWLLKFGFKKEIRSSIATSVKDVYNWSYNGMWIIKFNEAEGYCNYQSSIIVRYVHELQNAHFIFYREELTVK